MKKEKLAIVSFDSDTNSHLLRQLKSVFGCSYDIDGILAEKARDCNDLDFTKYRLIIGTGHHVFQYIMKGKPYKGECVICERTINKEQILLLQSIQNGAEVFVVSNYLDAAEDTINLLIDCGISHLKLVPCTFDMSFKSDSIIISTSENYCRNDDSIILNLGEKDITFKSIFEIFHRLGMPTKLYPYVLKEYERESLSHLEKIRDTMSILYGTSSLAESAIVCVDSDCKIFFCNKSFVQVTGKHQEFFLGKNIYEVINLPKLPKISNFFPLGNPQQHIVKFKDKMLRTSISILPCSSSHSMEPFYVISIQDITQIEELQAKIRKRSSELGFFAKATFEDIIGRSSVICDCLLKAKKVSQSDMTVLIQGESGTGKEIFAQAIHNGSRRKNAPFVAINLSAISDELAMSELFGYEEGAFTGAIKGGKKGLFEIANTGTIFLDEIGDISPLLQKRLLRVMQEKEIMPVGSNRIIKVNIRVIAATNRELSALVEEGKFRKDLYYRLNVLSIRLPNLCERSDDLFPLINYMMEERGIRKSFTQNAADLIENYTWPGNVRELENAVDYISCFCSGNEITEKDLPEYILWQQEKENLSNFPNSDLEHYKFIYSQIQSENLDKQFIAVLKILEHAENLGIKMGRTRISKHLKQYTIICSEGRIKSLLKRMERAGLVNIGSTKQGTCISEDGRRFLSAYRRDYFV